MSIQQLSRLPDEIKADITKVMQQASVMIPNALKPATPIRTGHLRRSWKGRHSKFQARIRNTAFYADYIESGTSRMKAQPMIAPIMPVIEVELVRSITTGTDFYIRGGAFSDAATQLKEGYRSKYGSYGSQTGYSG